MSHVRRASRVVWRARPSRSRSHRHSHRPRTRPTPPWSRSDRLRVRVAAPDHRHDAGIGQRSVGHRSLLPVRHDRGGPRDRRGRPDRHVVEHDRSVRRRRRQRRTPRARTLWRSSTSSPRTRRPRARRRSTSCWWLSHSGSIRRPSPPPSESRTRMARSTPICTSPTRCSPRWRSDLLDGSVPPSTVAYVESKQQAAGSWAFDATPGDRSRHRHHGPRGPGADRRWGRAGRLP